MLDQDQVGQQRLLAISAHPDDAEFTSGGSLARWAAEGWQITLVVCTDGSKGSQNAGDDPKTLSRTRRVEQESAARLLGIQEVAWLGHPDGGLEQAATLHEELTYFIRHYHPDLMLTTTTPCGRKGV
jgi:LmbE family N-acetylglucosaminyl deacetylase